jgi:hypothetical protein
VTRYRFPGEAAGLTLPPFTRRLTDVARVFKPGRPQTAATRAKLSRATFERRRREALARPDLHALQRARLTLDGDGVSIAALSDRAVVARAVIEAAEAGADVSPNSWLRLSRALAVPVETLRA